MRKTYRLCIPVLLVSIMLTILSNAVTVLAASEKAYDYGISQTQNIPTETVEVGDVITFGNYPQEADGTVKPIEWIVLEVKDGKALLISKYALDTQPYNEERADVTWETCTLRTWLNSDFLDAAFQASEQKSILSTTVVNADNPNYGTEGGNDTKDKVFLLSLDEVHNYFNLTKNTDESKKVLYANGEACCCKPTAYAKAQGAQTLIWNADPEYSNPEDEKYDGNCWWWLRSPGSLSYIASVVYSRGVVGAGADGHVYVNMIAVRPALWIDVFENSSDGVATWKKNSIGWWYQYADGSYPKSQWELVDGKWYHFDTNGYMQTGWILDSGKWYYLNAYGAMETGWVQVSGKWYYMNTYGVMETGWQYINGYWYYFSTGGAMQTGWQTINEKTYYFHPGGVMAASEYINSWWLNSDGSWTYQYQASWRKNSVGWWYGDESGWYAKNATYKIDGKSYIFDGNGYMK